jgi:hypothetical protein
LSLVELSSLKDSSSGNFDAIGVVGAEDVGGETLGNVILASRSGGWRLKRNGHYQQCLGSKNRSRVFVDHSLPVWKLRDVYGLGWSLACLAVGKTTVESCMSVLRGMSRSLTGWQPYLLCILMLSRRSPCGLLLNFSNNRRQFLTDNILHHWDMSTLSWLSSERAVWASPLNCASSFPMSDLKSSETVRRVDEAVDFVSSTLVLLKSGNSVVSFREYYIWTVGRCQACRAG